MQTQTLKVVGSNTMHCAGCENSVQFTLQQLPGIETVTADYKTQLVHLTFVPKTVSLQRVKEELDWIGYEVEEVSDA
jgi:copper chaperone CopZ